MTYQDPTRDEMIAYLREYLSEGYVDADCSGNELDIETAIYWFANQYHSGQSSNLYSALSTSPYSPGPLCYGIQDEHSDQAEILYITLVNHYTPVTEI